MNKAVLLLILCSYLSYGQTSSAKLNDYFIKPYIHLLKPYDLPETDVIGDVKSINVKRFVFSDSIDSLNSIKYKAKYKINNIVSINIDKYGKYVYKYVGDEFKESRKINFFKKDSLRIVVIKRSNNQVKIRVGSDHHIFDLTNGNITRITNLYGKHQDTLGFQIISYNDNDKLIESKLYDRWSTFKSNYPYRTFEYQHINDTIIIEKMYGREKKLTTETKFTFNKKVELLEKKVITLKPSIPNNKSISSVNYSSIDNYKYEYYYDKYNNWIEIKEFANEKLKSHITRTIKYE